MKFNKLFLIGTLLVAGLGFTSCSDKHEYVPGAPAGVHNIGFDSEQNVNMGLADSQVKVAMTRAKTEGELTVPIQPLMVPECMTLPKSVTFADGSATAEFIIAVDSTMELFTDYQLSFRVPEEYTNAYAADGKNPVFNITVKKEDFVVVAKGVYDSKFWFEQTWNQTLEYSSILGLYRIPDCYAKGSHWYFSFNGSDKFSFTDSEGNAVVKFLSGVVHPSYGAVNLNVLVDNPMGYTAGGEVTINGEVVSLVGRFAFPFGFTVSAGSFGSAYEYYYVLEWTSKPWETAAN